MTDQADRADTGDLDAAIEAAEEFYRRGALEESAAAYERALAIDPDHADALEWRGEIAVQQDDYETAADMLGRARGLRGDDAFAEYTNLGLSLYELGRSAEAVDALVRAVERDGGDLVSHSNLGKALYEYHHKVDAADAARIAAEWLAAFPDNPDARHIGSAISGKAEPVVANAAYVADVFDDYAANFDEKLADLDYKAPQLIAGLLTDELPPCAGRLAVLDAGCGTGLAGTHLKPYARRLEGVDLSPKMLARAEAKQLYDRLEKAEIVSFLDGAGEPYDLITAADVLCYFGALDKAFVAFSHALAPGGWVGFSVERLPADAAVAGGYRLDASGRYKHAPDYVRGVLEAAGFAVLRFEEAVLRYEYGEPVGGLVALVRKPE